MGIKKSMRFEIFKRDSFRCFLKKLSYEEIIGAIDIASGRCKEWEAERSIKYFCGICWHKIRGEEPNAK